MKIIYEQTISKLDELEAKYMSAVQKANKIKALIQKHNDGIDKLKVKIQKVLGMSYEELENLYNTDMKKYREVCDNDWDKMSLLDKIEDKQDSIKNNEYKLKDVNKSIDKWKSKIEQEKHNQDKIANDIPKVILDFMEQWKKSALEYYLQSYKDYVKYEEELESKKLQALYDLMMSDDDFEGSRQRYDDTKPMDDSTNYYILINLWPSRKVTPRLKELHLDYDSIRRALQNRSNYYIPRLFGLSEEEQISYLDKALEKEKNDLILDLYRRINEEVGDIVDASNLSIAANGQLNGIVVGTNGRAKLETIGAGGYNIQKFHFRTLIHKLKD